MTLKHFTIVLIFGARIVAAQDPNSINKLIPNPIPASPNVASLGKYGDYPVSYFTGLPEISIPLYEVRAGELSIPINLSYHASGIKPTDVASWVGSGWSLSAGGQISRTINGRPDEIAGGYLQAPLNPSPTIASNYSYLYNAASGIGDLEPDVFNYYISGHGGKFLWMHNNVPYLFPYAPLKITSTPNLSTFDIVDENGIRAQFGYNNNIESTVTTRPNLYPTGGKTSWYLTQLIAPNSQENIGIEYQTIGNFSYSDVSYSFTVIDACSSTNNECPPESTIYPQLYNISSSGAQLAPSVITFPNGKVRFFPSATNRADNNGKSLDRIEIQNADGTTNKTIKFIYSYFTSPNASSAALKLDEVRFLDAMGEIIQIYKLEYFTNSVSWIRGNLSDLNARDLWGYYNGATTNTNLLEPRTIPYLPNVGPATTLTFGGGFDRTVNPALVKEGVLKKITYPTGGFTEFEFESNQYLKSGTSTLAGGLRVKAVKSYEGIGASPTVRTFKYGLNETGLGSSNFWTEQFNYNASQFYYKFEHVITQTGTFTKSTEYTIRSFHSNVSYSYDSYSIMYPYVTEYMGEASGANLGYNKYVFDDGLIIDDVAYFVPASGQFYRNNRSWQRGKLTKKSSFDISGNIVSESSIGYTVHKNETRHVGFGVYQYYPITQSCCSIDPRATVLAEGILVYPNSLFWAPYSQSTGVALETSRTEKYFQLGDVAKFNTDSYTTGYHNEKLQPVTQTKSHSDGSLSTTIIKYPFDFESSVNASSTGSALGIYMLNQKNILTKPIETYSYQQIGTSNILTSGQVTKYRMNESNSTQVVADEIQLFRTDVPKTLASYVPVSVNLSNTGITTDAQYEPRIKFSHYGLSGNLVSVKKTNDLNLSYRYGYQQRLPVVEIQNAFSTLVSNDGKLNINFGGATSGLIQSSFTFKVDYTGSVYLKLGVNANPSYSTVANYSGISSGSSTIGKNGCGVTNITFDNVSPGTYTIVISLTTPDSGVASLGVCGEIIFPSYSGTTYGTTEFFYENFEEGSATGTATPHTGKKYLLGDYTTTFIKPNTRNYLIEYWYLNGSTWTYASTTYTNGMTLTNGSAIDNVRIYPSDARMKSYTYDPVLGVTSVIDENGSIQYYEYDTFGRLAQIKDDKGHILQQYKYNYKTN